MGTFKVTPKKGKDYCDVRVTVYSSSTMGTWWMGFETRYLGSGFTATFEKLLAIQPTWVGASSVETRRGAFFTEPSLMGGEPERGRGIRLDLMATLVHSSEVDGGLMVMGVRF